MSPNMIPNRKGNVITVKIAAGGWVVREWVVVQGEQYSVGIGNR